MFRPKSLSQIFTDDSFGPLSLFGLFFIAILMIPGIMALYNGTGLLREVTKNRIKRSAGSLCIIAVCLTINYINKLFFSDRFEDNFAMLSVLIATIIIIPVYILISKKIIKSEKMEVISKGEFIGKGILTLLSWEIWLALIELARVFVPVKEGFWNFLGFIVSILIALVFYKIASGMLNIKDVEQSGRLG